ncbi:L,D-transpeptidase family protein [Ornithinimicrobium faecis]|uniref:L,D-transpeptidase family protein n=1 Tax=Ornithinimicrobium faecis TaxID=2934158 RepID=A0ABY4YNU4_9MICO|nr:MULTISPECIES: L,D-transpeptidase family protein [unclassified Ornithinimicrobium]USQ78165.1 L,D-transpeptidase family protein [Ornithinimicrobium sp. HY1793]
MTSITHARMNRRTLLRGGLGVAAGAALLPLGNTLGGSALAATASTRLLRRGNTGTAVSSLQSDLSDTGYWCGSVDGIFGHLTQQAVWAAQKHHQLATDGVVGPLTRNAVASGSLPQPKGGGGTRIEVHLGRQLLLVVRGGQTVHAFNTSTGNGEPYTLDGHTYRAVTNQGSWKVYSTWSSGWQHGSLGDMWRPMYYDRGWAVHGSTSIPTYPASHGCSRLSTAAMDYLWSSGAMAMGSRVTVTG